MDAAQHLARAATYAAKGEEYYRKAAEEILAAKAADPALSNRKIAEAVGRSHVWVGKILKWHAEGGNGVTTPFADPPKPADENGPDDEWYTREPFIEAARRVLGEIDLDPASNAMAQEVVRATKYYSWSERKQDALKLQWKGRVFMNPPFSAAKAFGDRLQHFYSREKVTAAIMVVNPISAGNAWFQWYEDFPWCKVRRGVFYRRDGRLQDPFPWTGFVYLGHNFDAFTHEFSELGRVYKDPSGREWHRRFSSPPPWVTAAGEDL
jgi:hypothetical protein